jgi:hypothetical protein
MSTGSDEPDEGTRTFQGEITVGSRIIDYLSSGLYKSPAACLKELVNNSYDADATLVRVLVKPDADRIIIEDDGLGMTLKTFQRHFKRISESHKRDDSDITPSGRPKIGKIGIGFIAANEICEQMEIYSTAPGNPELLHVTIDFARMRERAEERRRGSTGDYAKADYHGEILNAQEEDHYTKVFLKSVRGEAQQILAGAWSSGGSQPDNSLYGLNPETVMNHLANLDSWSSLDDYSQTMLGVALNVPIRYYDQWIAEEHREAIGSFEREIARLNFNVEYDGTELRKPIVLTGDKSDSLVKLVEFDGEHVHAHGWFYGQHGILKPEDINGVLIRIRYAAVGEYDDSFLAFPHATGPLFQRWITSEIYADDRLEEALNIDRRTLREAHPAYVELRRWFHEELYDFIGEVRSHLYTEPAAERKRQQTAFEVERIKQIADEIGTSYGSDSGERVAQAWAPTGDERPPRRSEINQKFTVSSLYKTVLAVARETLPADQAREFIAELTRQLRK